MKAEPGYKQTEVGVIPEDWDVRCLVDVAEIRTGIAKNTKTSANNPIKVHYLRVANVQDGYLDLSEMSEIRVSSNDIKRFAVLPGDMLMNEGGDLDQLGRGAVWHGEYSPCIHQNHVFVVRCGKRATAEYINAWTGAAPSRRYFMYAGKQTTNLASINKTALGLLPVVLPAKAEQEAIAEALSDADALIETLEQLIAKKRQIKQGAMQELLTGKKRLPGFQTTPGHKQTEIGPIPKDWEVTQIGNLATKVGSGITPTGGSSNYRDYGRPFVRSQNVGWGTLLLDDLVYIDDDTHNEFPASELRKMDVLLNITGASIGRSAIANDTLAGGNVNQHVCIIRTDTREVAPRFINNFLLSESGQRQIDSFQAGGNREGLNFSQIRSIKLPLPPTKAEQEAIASILSDMDTEIVALETKLDKARQIKQGMMQELLTGRIRLV
jgi:type I restriction enzyme S subunit